MPSKTISVTNGDGSTRTITIPDRSRFAGVRNISRAVNALPLTDSTTSIQVTVAGHSDISGIYTGTTVAGATWTQQGGAGTITASGFNATDGYEYLLEDGDFDPQYLLSNNAGFTDRPWKANLGTAVTITGIAGTETLTVNRTAPVITSDRKGASRPLLSKVVGGASAAYSLRDLNDKAGNNKVVRVRRASDNAERDFLAKEVSNGTLKNWVNTQTVLPLDIQELNGTGRDGDFLISKAAYSLRSLGTRQATLAATGDTVARADGKFVVQVRRSSDNALKSFTADEVSDGTLVNFVTELITGWNTQPTWNTIAPSGTIRSQSSTASTSTLTFFAYGTSHTISDSSRPSHILANEGDVVDINLTVSNIQGSASIEIRAAGTDTALASSSTIGNGTVSASFTVNSNANGGAHIVFSSLETPGDFSDGTITINSVKVTGKTGFVKTWYDQSVTNQAGDTATGNHAVQAGTLSKPKIVNAGSLMLNEDGHPAIGFQRISGGSTYFNLTTGIDIANSHSFQYVEFQKTYTYTLVESSAGGSNRIGYLTGSQLRLYRGGSLNFSAGTTITNNPIIYTTFLAADGSASKVNVNGDEVLNQVLGNGTGGTTFNAIFRGDNSGLDSQFTKLSELIVYDTDQSDNRTAIEANIGEAYSISGIPAYDNTVDGFVETWYDQSGENFDMLQAESTKQPKIVENGNFLGSVKYDGTSDYLKAATTLDITNQALSLFAVQTRATSANQSTLGKTNSGRGVSFENAGTRVFITTKLKTFNHPTDGSGFLLGTAIHTGDGSSDQIKVTRNGVEITDTSINANDALASSQPISLTTYNVIGGNRSEASSTSFFNGEIKEVVIWKTNQLANRPAIEANINNQYDIY